MELNPALFESFYLAESLKEPNNLQDAENLCLYEKERFGHRILCHFKAADSRFGSTKKYLDLFPAAVRLRASGTNFRRAYVYDPYGPLSGSFFRSGAKKNSPALF